MFLLRFILTICKAIYYNWRNLVYYRQERHINRSRITILHQSKDSKRALTDACLATVGLKTIDDDKDAVPWYILLSKAQKSWIKQVTDQGYKVGLT